ncbi:MAG: hypothetical protein M1830_009497 [Pleopsidium flavum]|nr:MAG: hypothetical protein M1830_009497 [Pleopsidium flavum]
MQPVDTARKGASVWDGVSQKTFRDNVNKLTRLPNSVPKDPRVYTKEDWLGRGNQEESRTFPFEVERQLADDLAFIAASEEGGRRVSAVTIEEDKGAGLIVRLAANKGAPEAVSASLEKIFAVLQQCANEELSWKRCASRLFDLVMSLNRARIHGRLELSRWKIPKNRRGYRRNPLTRRLNAAAQLFITSQQSSSAQGALQELNESITKLDVIYRELESTPMEQDLDHLTEIVRQAFVISHFADGSSLQRTLKAYSVVDRIAKSKEVKQVDKLGKYLGVSLSTARLASLYKKMFSSIKLQPLDPFQGSTWASTKHFVHAEVQLIVHYELYPCFPLPRVIGASKEACYLCDLFIKTHRRFYVSKTHGRLYDGWTVPNLEKNNTSLLNSFRSILVQMNQKMKADLREAQVRKTPRPWQVESSAWQTPYPLPTPSTSTIRAASPVHAGTSHPTLTAAITVPSLAVPLDVQEDGDTMQIILRGEAEKLCMSAILTPSLSTIRTSSTHTVPTSMPMASVIPVPIVDPSQGQGDSIKEQDCLRAATKSPSGAINPTLSMLRRISMSPRKSGSILLTPTADLAMAPVCGPPHAREDSNPTQEVPTAGSEELSNKALDTVQTAEVVIPETGHVATTITSLSPSRAEAGGIALSLEFEGAQTSDTVSTSAKDSVAYSSGTISLSRPSEGETDACDDIIDVKDITLDTERIVKRLPGHDSLVLWVRSRRGRPIKIGCEWNH